MGNWQLAIGNWLLAIGVANYSKANFQRSELQRSDLKKDPRRSLFSYLYINRLILRLGVFSNSFSINSIAVTWL